jgi:hypothetical protein
MTDPFLFINDLWLRLLTLDAEQIVSLLGEKKVVAPNISPGKCGFCEVRNRRQQRRSC